MFNSPLMPAQILQRDLRTSCTFSHGDGITFKPFEMASVHCCQWHEADDQRQARAERQAKRKEA